MTDLSRSGAATTDVVTFIPALRIRFAASRAAPTSSNRRNKVDPAPLTRSGPIPRPPITCRTRPISGQTRKTAGSRWLDSMAVRSSPDETSSIDASIPLG